MPRPLGRRNPDYEEKRDRLVQDLADFVLRSDLVRASFRQWAQAGGVAEPTLRHYFGDRECVAREILRVFGERAQPWMAAVAEPTPSLEAAISTYVDLSRVGVATGPFARAHAFGLIEGVADENAGKAYLTELLEPSLAALQARLAAHVPPGTDLRTVALCLFAPMMLAVIHQDLLGGREAAPMDLDRVFQDIGRFVMAGVRALGDGPDGP